jgi:primosomal protein N'
MWIVEVIPIKKGLPQETLTYFSVESVTDGAIVSIPIRSRLVDAVVIGSKDAREEKSAIKSGSFSLKKISKIKTETSIPYYIFETATLVSRYYRRTRGEILNLVVPDYSLNGAFAKKTQFVKAEIEKIQPERLIFQAPLEDRLSFYKTCIRESFARKESVTIICPTISDCELFSESLSRGITDFVVTLHSEIPKKKCSEIINKITSEKHPFVLIVTPSFASLMRDDMKTMIIEHENSSAYSTPTMPSFDFRVIIEILAKTSGRKLIMGDSLLRVETLGRYETKELGSVAPVTFRALAPIEISVIPHGVPDTLPLRLRSEQIPALSETAQKVIEKGIAKKSQK